MKAHKPKSQLLNIWRIVLALSALVPAFLTSVLLRIGSTVWVVATGCWSLIFLGMYLIYLPLLYKKQSFEISAGKIFLTTGVFTSRVIAIPLSSIQYTTVSRSVFERMFGLSSVVVTAAGGGMTVAGLTIADAKALAASLRE